MRELKKGDLICIVPSHDELVRKLPPKVGIVLRDWDYCEHGDWIEVWFDDYGKTIAEPGYIQKLEEYGQWGY